MEWGTRGHLGNVLYFDRGGTAGVKNCQQSSKCTVEVGTFIVYQLCLCKVDFKNIKLMNIPCDEKGEFLHKFVVILLESKCSHF